MTLTELKNKYNLTDSAKFEPKSNCKFCTGTGERTIKSTNKLVFCICLFVDHSDSDWVGTELSSIASKHLKGLRKKNGE